MNVTLKRFTITDTCAEFGNELCTAIRSGLAKNTTLEELTLDHMHSSDDDGAVSARNALYFLRTNTTLKSLNITFQRVQEESNVFAFRPVEEESYVSSFRLEAVKLIEENSSLESLTIYSVSGKIKVEDFFTLVSALQRHTTLKTLGYCAGELSLTDGEVTKLVPLLMKNYGLELLLPKIRRADDRTVEAIFRLNSAGRRYLIKDGSSISKGVDVLSAVSDDIDCVFLHLLENPGLCNRRAADTTTGRQLPGSNLDESAGSGKRGRRRSHPGKERYRRLA
jgi:hypothetical protein